MLRVTDLAALAPARAAVELELAAIDRACSRFREDSELTRLNARSGRPVRVDPLLVDALEIALGAARLTCGDVDPTIGRALELAGYDRDWHALAARGREPAARGREQAARGREQAARGLEPAAPVTVTARVRPAWQQVHVDRDACTIRVPAGVRIDLGATAKAWAADRAARSAARAGACGALVSIGGDIAIGGSAPRGGWLVRVTDDHRSDPSAPGQTVAVLDGGLATSSTAVRRWSQRGAAMHHIIDPRTASPVKSSWRTVSVAAADCTQANIATTAAIVRRAAAPAWLESLGLPARLVDWSGRITTLGGWPAPAPGAVQLRDASGSGPAREEVSPTGGKARAA